MEPNAKFKAPIKTQTSTIYTYVLKDLFLRIHKAKSSPNEKSPNFGAFLGTTSLTFTILIAF